VEIHSFHVRTSGRDLTQVRRTNRDIQARKSGVVPVDKLKKAELVELAEAQGVDSSGTKADLVERLGSDE